MKNYAWRLNRRFDGFPIDRNDPDSAHTAQPLCFPHEFSDNAWRMLNYLDTTVWLFAYKGKLVVTDEAMELTVYGKGSPQSPLGGPRWVGDSFEEMEAWLEAECEGWLSEPEEDRPFESNTPVWRWPY